MPEYNDDLAHICACDECHALRNTVDVCKHEFENAELRQAARALLDAFAMPDQPVAEPIDRLRELLDARE